MHHTLHISRHQHHIRRFDGNIGPGANCNTHIRLGQHRRIIDAIAHECDLSMRLAQGFQRIDFTLGQDIGNHRFNAKALRHGFGCVPTVPGYHRHLHPTGLQRRDGVLAGWTQGIRDDNDCDNFVFDSNKGNGMPFCPCC